MLKKYNSRISYGYKKDQAFVVDYSIIIDNQFQIPESHSKMSKQQE